MTAKESSTGRVTVACKVPNGIVMRVFSMVDDHEPVMGGGTRRVKKAVPVGESVHIFGPAVPFGAAPRVLIAGGYALTTGVPEDIATEYMKQNADGDIVKNQQVFIYATEASARDAALERADIKSGLEPLDPQNLPAQFKKRDAKGKVIPLIEPANQVAA